MAAPEYTPLPTAPARTMTPTAFAAAADAFVAALAVFQTEGDTLGAYTQAQAEAALAAAIAGNLSELDLSALAGWVIGVNTAGDALEGVELVPPSNATETAAGIVEKATSAEGTTPVPDKYPDTIVAAEMIGGRAVGIGQTWQDVSGSRAHSTSYQNTTGRPIVANISYTGANVATRIWEFEISPDDSAWISLTHQSVGDKDNNSSHYGLIIPDTYYYRLTLVSGTDFETLQVWSELR